MENNKRNNIEYMKEYYKNNKEKHLKYMKEKIKCECGSEVVRCYIAKHKRSKIHEKIKSKK